MNIILSCADTSNIRGKLAQGLPVGVNKVHTAHAPQVRFGWLWSVVDYTFQSTLVYINKVGVTWNAISSKPVIFDPWLFSFQSLRSPLLKVKAKVIFGSTVERGAVLDEVYSRLSTISGESDSTILARDCWIMNCLKRVHSSSSWW
jgi:hypothetical protein